MEKQKTSVTLIILITILIVLIFGIYIILVKYQKPNKKINSNTTLNTKTTTTSNKDSSTNQQELNTKNSEDIYKEYLSNRKKDLKKVLTSENDINVYELLGESLYFNNNFNLQIDSELNLKFSVLDNEKYNNTLIDENVIDVFLVTTGNAGYNYAYYLKDDGTLKYFCIDCLTNEKLKIETSDKKNIIRVENYTYNSNTSAAYGVIFVDIQGNFSN